MKLLRRGTMGNEMPLVEVEGVLYDASPVGDFGPGFWKDNGVARLRRLLDAGRLTAVELADEVRHGSPVAAVGSVICIGQNYAAHAAELSNPHTAAGSRARCEAPCGSIPACT